MVAWLAVVVEHVLFEHAQALFGVKVLNLRVDGPQQVKQLGQTLVNLEQGQGGFFLRLGFEFLGDEDVN